MKKMILVALVLVGATVAQAASVQCRGVDGQHQQIAVRVSNIEVDSQGAYMPGELQVLTLNLGGRQTICADGMVTGNRNGTMVASCPQRYGTVSLTLRITGTNKYVGTFCAYGKNTQIAHLTFTDKECLENLYCDAKGLSK